METWLLALIGGGLIGVAASIMLITSGRVMGVSGIVSGVITPARGDWFWRVAVVVGLLFGGYLASTQIEHAFINETARPLGVIFIAGLLVGFGTRLGSGCTSGHGVCGISRLSPRSIVATLCFIGVGILTVTLFNAFFKVGL